jgi:phosphoserine aminotransferase
MTESPDIQLPPNLTPRDGRFGSGPARVRREDLEALAATGITYMGTSHRRDGVRSVVAGIRRGLRRLYELPDSYEVLLGIGGATAFWEAAAFGLIEARSQHLVFGEFSGKFAAVTLGAPWLDEPEIVESAPGSHPLPIVDPEIDTYCLTHNETSTGVAMPVVRPGGGAALVLVDATSAAGAVEVDPLEFDAYYFSPQKALGSDGGLWVALCSPMALTRIEAVAAERWIPPFMSLQIALDNSRKDQTYNTPALATLYLLNRQIEWLLERGGLEWAAARSRTAAALLYDWAGSSDYASPFVEVPAQRSSTTVTIDLDSAVPAGDVIAALMPYGIVDISGYRKLGRNQLRIATFPSVDLDDVGRLTGAIDFVAARLR